MRFALNVNHLAYDDFEVCAPAAEGAGVTASGSASGVLTGVNFATVLPMRKVRLRTLPAFAAPPTGRNSENKSTIRTNGASAASIAVTYASSGRYRQWPLMRRNSSALAVAKVKDRH
jgi:hypothetical protein